MVVENFLPGARGERSASTASRSSGDRPELVYCSITGYPPAARTPTGPATTSPSRATAGIMSMTGEPDGEPMKVGVAIADITTGMFAASGILAA